MSEFEKWWNVAQRSFIVTDNPPLKKIAQDAWDAGVEACTKVIIDTFRRQLDEITEKP